MPGEDFNIYHLIYVNLHVKHGSNLIRTLLINPKYEKHGILSYFWALRGVLTLNPGVPRCRPHHIGDICTTR